MLRKEKRRPSLLSGVLLLTVANLGVKLIGLVFKIPLSHMLGDEGMGYFNAAYTIYSWLYIISTAGLPVAVSIMISDAAEREDHRTVDRVFRVAMTAFLTIGIVGCLLMTLLSSPLSSLIGNRGSRDAIVTVAPTLLFVSIVGGLRGYFQGCKRMLPTAMSQLIEAAGKLVLGMLFGRYAASRGEPLQVVAAYAILGVTLGTAIGALYLGILGIVDRRRSHAVRSVIPEKRESGTLTALLKIAVPITVSSAVMSLTNLIDLGVIMNRLTGAGYSEAAAAALFGNYTTLVVPMSHLPTVLIYPIASTIVPYLSSELAKSKKEGAVALSEAALRFVSIITLPAAAGLALFGGRILSLFFKSESAAIAAPALAVLAPGIFFLGVVTVTNAILEANGRAGATVRSMVLGALLKTVLSYLLIGNPSFGIYGAAIGTVACYAVTSVVNLIEMHRVVGRLPSFHAFFIKPLAATGATMLIAVGICKLTESCFWGSLHTLLLLLFTVALYAVFLFLFRVFEATDLSRLPFGRKILAHFNRIAN